MIFNWVVAENASGELLARVKAPRGSVTRPACTVRQACRLLRKSRRHVYRYLKMGELTSYGKFLGEWLLDQDGVRRLAALPPGAARPPRYTQALFPDYPVRSLSVHRDRTLILARILDRGDTREAAWVLKRYPAQAVRDFLAADGARLLSPRSLRFWSLFLGIKPPTVPAWRRLGRKLGGA